MKKKKNYLFASGLVLAAGTAIASYLIKNKKGKIDEGFLPSSDCEDEIYFNFSENTKISYADAEQKAIEAAKNKLGKSAVVVSASDKKAITVNIADKRRHCFMFGAAADSMSLSSETVLFYVDSVTGEVFESDGSNG